MPTKPQTRKRAQKNKTKSKKASPKEKDVSKNIAALDRIYNVIQGNRRMMWFDKVKQKCDVLPVLANTFGGDAHANKGPAITINFDIDGGSGMIPPRKLGPLREVVESGRRYGWIPLKLVKANFSLHANALWVDNKTRRIVLFEPHGSDASDARHPVSFRNTYVSSVYFESLRRSCAEFSNYTVITPDQYEPAVFGQSTSRVQGSSDPWCVLWTLFFFYRMTFVDKGNYNKFVAFIERKAANGTLADFMKGLLLDTSWMSTSECS
jgi:hypothetical protein